MPKMKGYERQVGASGQGLSSGQDLGFIQREARATQELIGTVVDGAGAIYKREAQIELSDLNARFSDARAEWQTRIDEDVRNGSVDSEKIKSDYQAYVNKINEGINTAEGRSYFDRQAARLNVFVMKNATRGQALVAGARAEQDWRTSLNKSSNVLQNDPSAFRDVYDSTLESIEAQVAAGAIPASIAEKFKTQTGTELAKNAVRGMILKDPALAKTALDKGSYDNYLDPDTKAQLRNSANSEILSRQAQFQKTLLLKYKDPWSYVSKVGDSAAVKPIDLGQNAAQSFKDRMEAITDLNQKHGINLPFVSDREAQAISEKIMSMPPAQAVEQMSNLDSSVSDDLFKAKFGQAVFKQEPAMASAMMMAADAPMDARKIMGGLNKLREVDGKAAIRPPSTADTERAFDAYLGNAIEDPAARRGMRQAVVAHMVQSMFENNRADFDQLDESAFRSSAHAVLGPQIRLNGRSSLSFRGKDGAFVEEDEFMDLIGAMTDSDIEAIQKDVPRTMGGEPINFKKSRDRINLVPSGDGLYLIKMDGGWAWDRNKNPFELNLKGIHRDRNPYLRTRKDPGMGGAGFGL